MSTQGKRWVSAPRCTLEHDDREEGWRLGGVGQPHQHWVEVDDQGLALVVLAGPVTIDHRPEGPSREVQQTPEAGGEQRPWREIRRQTEVRLSLTRSSNATWRLDVTDRRSGVKLLQGELSSLDFSDLLAGQALEDLTVLVGDLTKVGLYAEHDDLLVPRDRERDPVDAPRLIAAMRKAQDDGWATGTVYANNRNQWVIPLTRWHTGPPRSTR
jgi:hypothetical protein